MPDAANSTPINHPGRQIARVALGSIHSTLLVTTYSTSQCTWVQPTNTRRIEAVVATHSLATCVCMPNAPRKHMLQWLQGPRLAAKREIGHGRHAGNTDKDGRPGGAACANRAYNRVE